MNIGLALLLIWCVIASGIFAVVALGTGDIGAGIGVSLLLSFLIGMFFLVVWAFVVVVTFFVAGIPLIVLVALFILFLCIAD